MAKDIKLKRKRDGAVSVFNFDHALRLLRRNSKDWSIEDKSHEFKDNEIVRVKPNKGNSKETKTSKADTKS